LRTSSENIHPETDFNFKIQSESELPNTSTNSVGQKKESKRTLQHSENVYPEKKVSKKSLAEKKHPEKKESKRTLQSESDSSNSSSNSVAEKKESKRTLQHSENLHPERKVSKRSLAEKKHPEKLQRELESPNTISAEKKVSKKSLLTTPEKINPEKRESKRTLHHAENLHPEKKASKRSRQPSPENRHNPDGDSLFQLTKQVPPLQLKSLINSITQTDNMLRNFLYISLKISRIIRLRSKI